MSTSRKTVFHWRRFLAWVKQRLRPNGRLESEASTWGLPQDTTIKDLSGAQTHLPAAGSERVALDVHQFFVPGTHLSELSNVKDQDWTMRAGKVPEDLLPYNSSVLSPATFAPTTPACPAGETSSLPEPQAEVRQEGLGPGLRTSPSKHEEEEEEKEEEEAGVKLALVETGRSRTTVKGWGSRSYIRMQLTYCLLVLVLLAGTLVLQYVLVRYLVAPLLDTREENKSKPFDS